MSATPHRLEILCTAANPVLYLACCGLFDLLTRLDPEAVGHWRAPEPTAFLLDTALTEAEFLATLLGTFCAPDRWKYEPPASGSEPTLITATFNPPGRSPLPVPLDWWFETAEFKGEVADKSAWKMYAGQQTVEKITRDMVAAAAALRKRGKLPEDFTALLAYEAAMSGRFGLDPRSSRNALEVGFSSNDLGLPVNTAPFTELLAVFGLASFFPGRTGRAGKLSSCRGWFDRRRKDDNLPAREPGFHYHLWPYALPIVLARRAAVHSAPGHAPLFSVRATRKNYSNLTLAQLFPTNL